MGMHNRTYWKDDNSSRFGGGGGGNYRGGGGRGMGMNLPKPGPAVGGLLIANLVMFLVQHIVPATNEWLTVIPSLWWEAWRYLTFQFLHGGVFHILFNMLGLYFLGNYLERSWGPKRFLTFYLVCGAFAGLTHVGLTFLFNWNPNVPLLGASGGVYAVIIACAILFPGIQLILMFFPVPIRFAALLFFVISGLSLLSGDGGGVSHAAHFGGMVLGGAWVWLTPRIKQASADAQAKVQQGVWEKKMRKEQASRAEIDKILDKIKQNGIGSLSNKEKKTLQDATDQQRREDQRINNL